MLDNSLPVPHRLQKQDGYCLPACVEMVLAYLGISASQEQFPRFPQTTPKPSSECCPVGGFSLAFFVSICFVLSEHWCK